MHIFRLYVELLVFLHKALAFFPESAAVLFEIATEFNQVENIDHVTPTESDKIENELSHHRLPCLSSIAFSPFFTSLVLVLRFDFLFLPEDIKALKELMEIKLVSHW